MPTRLGLRVNPVSGTATLGLELSGGISGNGIGLFNGDLETQVQFDASMVLDADGGSLGFFGGPMTRYGLTKTVSSGTPWTIWLEAPEGVWTFSGGEIDIVDDVDPQSTRIRLIVEVDDVETEVFDITQIALSRDNGFSDSFSSFGETVDLEFGGTPVDYSNFWTDFIKTRENAP